MLHKKAAIDCFGVRVGGVIHGHLSMIHIGTVFAQNVINYDYAIVG